MSQPAPAPQTFDLFASVFTAPTGATDLIFSENWSEPLTVVMRTWGPMDGVPPTDLPADEVRLSADGRAVIMEWHRGPEVEAVYVEVRRRRGRSFHGLVDAVSRKIVQVG